VTSEHLRRPTRQLPPSGNEFLVDGDEGLSASEQAAVRQFMNG
jgi:hypothetical protein